jgi:hypothetical protein
MATGITAPPPLVNLACSVLVEALSGYPRPQRLTYGALGGRLNPPAGPRNVRRLALGPIQNYCWYKNLPDLTVFVGRAVGNGAGAPRIDFFCNAFGQEHGRTSYIHAGQPSAIPTTPLAQPSISVAPAERTPAADPERSLVVRSTPAGASSILPTLACMLATTARIPRVGSCDERRPQRGTQPGHPSNDGRTGLRGRPSKVMAHLK